MIEWIVFFIFIIFFLIVLFNNMRLNIKIFSITKRLLQAEIDKNVLSKKLSELSSTDLIKKDQSSEAFLKFISDSRDMAYQYIEDTQFVLDKFITEIEPEILYFDEFGVVGTAYPHYYSMKKISVAYKELKKLLPEEYGKIDT
jgi:hypothetical protein